VNERRQQQNGRGGTSSGRLSPCEVHGVKNASRGVQREKQEIQRDVGA